MDLSKLSLIEKSLRNHGSVRVRLEGKSMEPLIHNGTALEIKATKFDDIGVSEIIAFKKRGRVVVHQCIYRSKLYLVTWGVNNNFSDGRVYYKNILGKVSLPLNTGLYNHLLLSEATRLNISLKKIKANPIWMKGPIYSKYLFGYFLNYKTPDLDVLIDRHKFDVTKKYLLKCGYKMEKKSPSRVRSLPYKEISFIKVVGEVKIKLDLHLIAVRCTFQKIFPQPLEPWRMILVNDELIRRPIKFKGFCLFNDTSSLIHLCLNLMFHHAGRGIWEHVRMAKLVEKGDVDWHRFELFLKEFQLTNYVYFPLLWSKRMFGIKVENLNYFKPPPLKLWLCKLAINKYTIGRQILLDGKSIKGWINNGIIFYLKIVLHSFLSESSRYKE